MIYRDFQGKDISLYTMGCMRLPVIDGVDTDIDEAAASEMVDYCYEQGVNYYDTAYGYHGGNSERFLAKALVAKYPRETFMLADKFPGYDPSNWGHVEEIFEEQLERCGVEYFDFYMFHNVCEMNIDAYTDEEKYGIFNYLMEQKRNGRIKHLGLSTHGNIDTLKRFMDKYGADMEFCQVQLNYLDVDFQDCQLKLDLMRECNIPIWVMEPLRGGGLCKLTDGQMDMLDVMRPGDGPVDWALHYLETLPQVTTILVGSSTLEQTKQNIEILSNPKPLDEAEMMILKEVTKDMLGSDIPPCTNCKYCAGHCPQNINIPWMIDLYSEHKYSNGGFIAPMALGAVPEGQRPQDCTACGNCTEVCPQQIEVAEILEKFVELMGA